MIRPRWQNLKGKNSIQVWSRWSQGIALIATINFAWIVFDLTYLPLRNFWLNRDLYPLPSTPLVIPFKWLPNITSLYDPIKGIKPHEPSQRYIKHFEELDQRLSSENINSTKINELLKIQASLINQLIERLPYIDSARLGNIDKLKSLLRTKAKKDSATEASNYLLNKSYLSKVDWQIERLFWQKEIIPLISSNYIRINDKNGNPLNLSWKIDIPFQLIFLLDILIRAGRLKKRLPGISWNNALLRRWIDLPLLIPFWRWLRLIPVTERLSNSRLIQIEPLRAAISQGVVALLAIELFEVFTLRIIDSLQSAIRSPLLPQRIRSLRSHQSVEQKENNEVIQLVLLWIPLLLTKVGPNMRKELIALFDHALNRSLKEEIVPAKLKDVGLVQKAESALSSQLATSMVDTLLELSKGTGQQISKQDPVLEKLGVDTLDRFWEELACTLEQEAILDKSQELLIRFLEEFKLASVKQVKAQGSVDELISELDGLNFRPEKTAPTNQA